MVCSCLFSHTGCHHNAGPSGDASGSIQTTALAIRPILQKLSHKFSTYQCILKVVLHYTIIFFKCAITFGIYFNLKICLFHNSVRVFLFLHCLQHFTTICKFLMTAFLTASVKPYLIGVLDLHFIYQLGIMGIFACACWTAVCFSEKCLFFSFYFILVRLFILTLSCIYAVCVLSSSVDRHHLQCFLSIM